MTKSDLKTGYIVTLRDGGKAVVVKNMTFKECEKDVLIFQRECQWEYLDVWNEDLKHHTFHDHDIVLVEKGGTPYNLFDIDYEHSKRTVIWGEVESVSNEEYRKEIAEIIGNYSKNVNGLNNKLLSILLSTNTNLSKINIEKEILDIEKMLKQLKSVSNLYDKRRKQ
jgi:hypothetical protein